MVNNKTWDRAIVKWGTAARQFRGKPFKYRKELNGIYDGTAAIGLYAWVTALQPAEFEDEIDNDSAIRDPDKVPRTAGDLEYSFTWPVLNNSQFTGLKALTSVTSVNTPVPETPLSNALKRKQRAADSASR